MSRRHAYTLAELVIVMAIIAILLGIGVPALSSAMHSADRAAAGDQLRLGLQSARSLAIRSERGDVVAAFLFAPASGGSTPRLTIVPCQLAGEFEDRDADDLPVRREVFVPMPEARSVVLPQGWSVRAYAAPGELEINQNGKRHGWYDVPAGAGARDFPPGDPRPGQWVFPETSFYATEGNSSVSGGQLGQQGLNRQSFVVRFRAGTGQVMTSDARQVLVVDAVASLGTTGDWRPAGPPWADHRLDLAPDQARFVSRLLSRSDVDGDGAASQADLAWMRALLGDEATDSILCRNVVELALYDERELVARVGSGKPNAATGTIYGDEARANDLPAYPRFDRTTLPTGMTAAQMSQDISAWLEGRLVRGGRAVETTARLFTLNRYSGELVEVKP